MDFKTLLTKYFDDKEQFKKNKDTLIKKALQLYDEAQSLEIQD